MDFGRLPNDILKEIIESLDTGEFADLYTLQKLRLVNRRFHAFATPVLFRSFDTLGLGESIEETEDHIRAFCKSNIGLQEKLLRLRIPSSSILPRFFSKNWIENEQATLLRMKDRLMADLVTQIDVLLDFMGQDFRFHSVGIGMLSKDTDPVKDLDRHDQIRGHFFACLARKLMTDPAFNKVRSLAITLHPFELYYFLRASGPIHIQGSEPTNLGNYEWPENPAANLSDLDQGMIGFLKHIRSFQFSFLHNDGEWGDDNDQEMLLLGDIISNSKKARRVTVRYAGNDFLPFFTPENKLTLYSIEKLCLKEARCRIHDDVDDTWDRFPNLTTLRFEHVFVGASRHGWSFIFDAIRDKLENLVSIYFEGLRYDDSPYPLPGSFIKYDAKRDRKLKRPLITSKKEDIDTFRKLRETVEKRRDKRGLEQDWWLSVFCKKEENNELEPSWHRNNGRPHHHYQ